MIPKLVLAIIFIIILSYDCTIYFCCESTFKYTLLHFYIKYSVNSISNIVALFYVIIYTSIDFNEKTKIHLVCSFILQFKNLYPPNCKWLSQLYDIHLKLSEANYHIPFWGVYISVCTLFESFLPAVSCQLDPHLKWLPSHRWCQFL